MVIFLRSAKSETLCSWEHRTQGKVKEEEHEGACLCIHVRVCRGEWAAANPVYVLLSVMHFKSGSYWTKPHLVTRTKFGNCIFLFWGQCHSLTHTVDGILSWKFWTLFLWSLSCLLAGSFELQSMRLEAVHSLQTTYLMWTAETTVFCTISCTGGVFLAFLQEWAAKRTSLQGCLALSTLDRPVCEREHSCQHREETKNSGHKG